MFGLTFSSARSVFSSRADQRRLHLVAVFENDGDLVGAFDDVVVGDDIARGIDDEAGAQRLHAPRPVIAVGEVLEEVVERRALRRLRGLLLFVGRRFSVCEVEMFTTVGNSRSARSAKPVEPASTFAGTVTGNCGLEAAWRSRRGR